MLNKVWRCLIGKTIYIKRKIADYLCKAIGWIGKNDRALNILRQAEEALKNHAIRGNVLWVDEADILMDQGIYDNRVWELLQNRNLLP